MKSLAARIKRLQIQQLGASGNCPACGQPLDQRRWDPPLILRVIHEDDPEPEQCSHCLMPRILRIVFD